jgi:acylphosphatase
MPAVRFIIRGRVQGVGFRYFTRKTAISLGVAGEVWNRSDGAVEAIVEHSDSSLLDEFASAIEAGPGYIRDIQMEATAERGLTTFEIGPSR